MLYLAPQDEILNQIKNYIIKYVHGKQDTVGKTEDEIIAEVFPNITFETYSGLLAKRGQEIIKDQYGMIVLDELHRTGAKEWEGKINTLLDNQNEEVKVLGITATPVRDIDGRDMAEETAKKLGYTDEEVKQRNHLASNMTLENAIRMGYVVNPKLVYCKYDLISSGKMDELREKIDDIEDESKRAEELQKYNELRSKLNKEIDAEIGEEARKQLEEEARKNLDNGIGKEEILRQNVKKGGKYIVFIPVTDQGDIEDEDGNRIGTKTGEDKIKAYQEYLDKVFSGTEIVPQLHSLLGSYSKDKNKEELEAFETDNTDETKFMVVMNKANEGLHIDGVDGIIWFRALDENSRILYLQQLGRAIYALDEDNPLPDDKRPVVIDLANNSLTVKIEKEFENSEPIDDLESLKIVIEWINEHDGMLPARESSNKQEQHYYAVLRRIQSKYNKYLDGFEEYSELDDDEKNRIQEIIELSSEIDLWSIDLPPILQTRGSKEKFDPFTVEGVLRNYVEFEDEINEIDKLTSFEKIIKFAEENGRMPKRLRKKASEMTKEEKEEESLYNKWLRTEERKTVDRYVGIDIKEIPEENRELVEMIRNYGYGLQSGLTTFEEIMKFTEENGRMPKASHKKASEMTEKENEEHNLYQKWLRTEEKKIVDRYAEIDIEEIPEEHRELVQTIRNYGYLVRQQRGLITFEEIMKFAEENGRMPKRLRKKASEMTKEEKEEESLYNKWLRTEERKTVDRYVGIDIKEIPEENRELVEMIRNYGYGLQSGLTTFEEIMKFTEENGRMPKASHKKASEMTEKENEEHNLYQKWLRTEEKKIVDRYAEIDIEEIPEEHRELVQTIRNYGYLVRQQRGLITFEEIMKFAEENGRMPKVSHKKASEMTKEEKEEESLYKKWLKTEEKKIVDGYAGIDLEKIPEEDRELVQTIRNYGYGLQSVLSPFEEVMKFAEENGRMPKKVNKKASEMTKEEKENLSLYNKWLKTEEKKIVDRYAKIDIKEIPEEDRELVQTIRNYGYLGKQQSELTLFEEIMKFAEENGRMPKVSHKKASEMTKEEKEEFSLYNKWRRTEEKKTVDRYAGIELEEIPEEDRELVQTIREYGLQSGLTPFGEIMKFAEENGRMPKKVNKKTSEMTKEEMEEISLYRKWLKTEERKTVDRYAGIDLEEIPEENRELVELIRKYGVGIKPSKLTQAKNQRDSAKEKNEQSKELEKRVSEQLKKRGQAYEEQ